MSVSGLIVSGHQPAYLPWLGLMHKAALCDVFVFMDDVQYLERSWNNRNRIKGPQGPTWLTVPVAQKHSPSRCLRDIRIDAGRSWQEQHWKALRLYYGLCPGWSAHAPFLEAIYLQRCWQWLWELCLEQFRYLLDAFALSPRLVIASEEGFTRRKSDLVLEHCLRYGADICVTGRHGRDYIAVGDFAACGIKVLFQDYRHPHYPQRFGVFEPCLSAFDLLFNQPDGAPARLLQDNVTREQVRNAGIAAPPGLFELSPS
jgi:hypothetical protein